MQIGYSRIFWGIIFGDLLIHQGTMTVLTRKQQYVAVGYLGVCFMLMFTAFNSLQNMISSLYLSLGFGSLGQMSVLILYASFGACSFLAAYVIERIGYRRLMFICSLGYCCFNLAGLYASSCEGKLEQARCNLGIIQCVVVVFSALTGMCASFIWVNSKISLGSSSSICERGVNTGD